MVVNFIGLNYIKAFFHWYQDLWLTFPFSLWEWKRVLCQLQICIFCISSWENFREFMYSYFFSICIAYWESIWILSGGKINFRNFKATSKCGLFQDSRPVHQHTYAPSSPKINSAQWLVSHRDNWVLIFTFPCIFIFPLI